MLTVLIPLRTAGLTDRPEAKISPLMDRRPGDFLFSREQSLVSQDFWGCFPATDTIPGHKPISTLLHVVMCPWHFLPIIYSCCIHGTMSPHLSLEIDAIYIHLPQRHNRTVCKWILYFNGNHGVWMEIWGSRWYQHTTTAAAGGADLRTKPESNSLTSFCFLSRSFFLPAQLKLL